MKLDAPPAAPHARLSWALCIATLDRIDILEMCVTQALLQSRLPKEIIVVDASDDFAGHHARIAALVAPSAMPLTYLRAPKRSLTTQRNCGIAAATADVLFLLDDDSLMYPDCAERIMEVYESDPACRIAAVSATNAPRMDALSVAGLSKSTGAYIDKAAGLRQRSALVRFVMPEVLMMSVDRHFIAYDGTWRSPTPTDLAPFAAFDPTPLCAISGYRMTVRRLVALREPFDGDLLAYSAAEDLDASYRFSRHGWNLQAPLAKLYHHEAIGGRLKRRQAVMLAVLNVAFFVRKRSARPARDITRFYIMVIRRILAEMLKDAAGRRWSFPQMRGVARAAILAPTIFAQGKEKVVSYHDALQRRVLGWPAGH